jgi:hypothetical protein
MGTSVRKMDLNSYLHSLKNILIPPFLSGHT